MYIALSVRGFWILCLGEVHTVMTNDVVFVLSLQMNRTGRVRPCSFLIAFALLW